MAARSFLDTNVLVYTDDHDAPLLPPAAHRPSRSRFRMQANTPVANTPTMLDGVKKLNGSR